MPELEQDRSLVGKMHGNTFWALHLVDSQPLECNDSDCGCVKGDLLVCSHASMYVDGTDGARLGSKIVGPAAGFCVIEQRKCGRLVYCGYDGWAVSTSTDDARFIGAERHTNGVAELFAQAFAMLLALQANLSSATICYDAIYAESAIGALNKPKANRQLVKLTVGLRELADKTIRLSSLHVQVHNGQPWNELGDIILDATSRRGIGFASATLPASFCNMLRNSSDALRWLGHAVHKHGSSIVFPPGTGDGQMRSGMS